MVHKTNLVIIGISVGIFIASVNYFVIRWFKKHAYLRQCANERSISTLPIRMDGQGTSCDSSASLSNSVTVKVIDHPANKSQLSWWNHHNKNRIPSTSGVLKYPYKDVQKATQNFTTILGQGAFGPVYKATMPAGVVAVKVLASNSKQGRKNSKQRYLCLVGFITGVW